MEARQRTVLIRTDPTPDSKSGAISRQLALAALVDHGTRVFFVVRSPEAVDHVRAATFEVFLLMPGRDGRDSPLDEARQLREMAREREAAWIVVDLPDVGDDYLATLAAGNARVLLVDENGRSGSCPADLVLPPDFSPRNVACELSGPTPALAS